MDNKLNLSDNISLPFRHNLRANGHLIAQEVGAGNYISLVAVPAGVRLYWNSTPNRASAHTLSELMRGAKYLEKNSDNQFKTFSNIYIWSEGDIPSEPLSDLIELEISGEGEKITTLLGNATQTIDNIDRIDVVENMTNISSEIPSEMLLGTNNPRNIRNKLTLDSINLTLSGTQSYNILLGELRALQTELETAYTNLETFRQVVMANNTIKCDGRVLPCISNSSKETVSGGMCGTAYGVFSNMQSFWISSPSLYGNLYYYYKLKLCSKNDKYFIGCDFFESWVDTRRGSDHRTKYQCKTNIKAPAAVTDALALLNSQGRTIPTIQAAIQAKQQVLNSIPLQNTNLKFTKREYSHANLININLDTTAGYKHLLSGQAVGGQGLNCCVGYAIAKINNVSPRDLVIKILSNLYINNQTENLSLNKVSLEIIDNDTYDEINTLIDSMNATANPTLTQMRTHSVAYTNGSTPAAAIIGNTNIEGDLLNITKDGSSQHEIIKHLGVGESFGVLLSIEIIGNQTTTALNSILVANVNAALEVQLIGEYEVK